jgi:hypothetical protein
VGHRCCVLLALLGLVGSSQPHDRSGIEGFVTSDVGAAIPNATVGVDSLTKGLHRESVTNTSGYYLVNELDPGAYSVRVEVKGLGCIVYPHVAVLPGHRVRQNFHFARAKRYPGNCEPAENQSK